MEIIEKNILLTSIGVTEMSHPVHYFAARGQYENKYCDAIMGVEASTKYVLSKYDIDEIIVIGRTATFDEGDDDRPIPLREGSSFYKADISYLSVYSLYRYRIAQFIDELTIEQQEYGELLTEDEQNRVIDFINNFLKNLDTKHASQKKLSHLFDLLANDKDLYYRFVTEIIEAIPEIAHDQDRYAKWVGNYIYAALSPSSKFAILPINDDVCVRFLPLKGEGANSHRMDNVLELAALISEKNVHANLYISLHSEDATDSFIIMSIFDILNKMPGSNVSVKKVFTVSDATKEPSGVIYDSTESLNITELVSATYAFLKYGKVDMISDFWNRCGEKNERIDRMIYAMRHIDVGLSICNVAEVEKGINQLRDLFSSDNSLGSGGYYTRLFNVIVQGIKDDYDTLLTGNEIPFIDLAKWAYRHGFYQQTLTYIESRAPENLVLSGLFYYCGSEDDVSHIIDLLAKERLELKYYEYYKIDESINHYFIKNYNRRSVKKHGKGDIQAAYASERVASIGNTDENMITGYSACDDKELLYNLLYSYYHAGDVRNKINHADDSAMDRDKKLMSSESDTPALDWIKEAIDFFIDSYDKAIAAIGDKTPNVITIPPSAVKSCAEKMMKENNDNKQ